LASTLRTLTAPRLSYSKQLPKIALTSANEASSSPFFSTRASHSFWNASLVSWALAVFSRARSSAASPSRGDQSRELVVQRLLFRRRQQRRQSARADPAVAGEGGEGQDGAEQHRVPGSW
jgi:hypothetical protein